MIPPESARVKSFEPAIHSGPGPSREVHVIVGRGAARWPANEVDDRTGLSPRGLVIRGCVAARGLAAPGFEARDRSNSRNRVQKSVLAGLRRGGPASAGWAVKQSQILAPQIRFAMAFSSLPDYPLDAFSFPGGGGAMGVSCSDRDPGTGPSTHSATHATTGQSPAGGECVAERACPYLVGRPSGPKGPTKPTKRTKPTELVRWSTKHGQASWGDAAVRSRVGAHGSS